MPAGSGTLSPKVKSVHMPPTAASATSACRAIRRGAQPPRAHIRRNAKETPADQHADIRQRQEVTKKQHETPNNIPPIPKKAGNTTRLDIRHGFLGRVSGLRQVPADRRSGQRLDQVDEGENAEGCNDDPRPGGRTELAVIGLADVQCGHHQTARNQEQKDRNDRVPVQAPHGQHVHIIKFLHNRRRSTIRCPAWTHTADRNEGKSTLSAAPTISCTCRWRSRLLRSRHRADRPRRGSPQVPDSRCRCPWRPSIPSVPDLRWPP